MALPAERLAVRSVSGYIARTDSAAAAEGKVPLVDALRNP